MTITTSLGIQTALSGLQAYQAAIATTGENIANANTPGYSRQRVTLGESSPLDIANLSRNTGAGAQVGTGVSIDDIARVRDAFLDVQYRAQSSNASHDSTMSSELAQVQTALGDSSGAGVANALQSFYKAFNAMASSGSPPSPASRSAALAAAQTLAGTFNSVSSQMGTVRSQASDHLDALTATPNGQLAQDAQQIATLNGQIKTETAAGRTPNDLLDQRDKLIDDLSSLGRTTSTPDPSGNGGVTVTFGGQPLIAADDTVTLPTSAQVIANPSAYGGTVGALGELADTGPNGAITKLSAQLDTVATTLQGNVNADLGNQAFFTGTGAGDLQVSAGGATILAGATSAQATAVAAESGGAVDQNYAAFVGSVGSAVQSAQNASSTSSSLLSAVDSRRQSVSGVSLDEEMANLITFQQGYQASARMLSTMDNVIGTLINVVGGAGL